MSLLLTPSSSHPSTHTHQTSAPSAPGVPDTLRSRLGQSLPVTSSASAPTSSKATASSSSSHPLEARLSAWRATADATRFTLLARQYGLAEPVRRRMELQACAVGEWRPAALGGAGRSFGSPWGSGGMTGQGVHADIMLGRDGEFGWEDVFVDRPLDRVVEFHAEMEGRSGMHSW